MKLKPGLRAFYAIQPGNESGLLYRFQGQQGAIICKNTKKIHIYKH